MMNFSKLISDLCRADRIEKVTRNHSFHAEISRVENPSSIYAIPCDYLDKEIPQKMERFLQLHSQLKSVDKCSFIEMDTQYVLRMKHTDIRVEVVSKK